MKYQRHLGSVINSIVEDITDADSLLQVLPEQALQNPQEAITIIENLVQSKDIAPPSKLQRQFMKIVNEQRRKTIINDLTEQIEDGKEKVLSPSTWPPLSWQGTYQCLENVQQKC